MKQKDKEEEEEKDRERERKRERDRERERKRERGRDREKETVQKPCVTNYDAPPLLPRAKRVVKKDYNVNRRSSVT